MTADLILMAAGVKPCAGLAETAGLDVEDGRIVVDAHMRTLATRTSTPRATSRSPTTPPPAATWRSSTGARR